MSAPLVFISYSHDSQEIRDRILNLSNRLRREGIDCSIDQYEVMPEKGWPQWCADQIKRSEYVLVVCTRNYFRRFNGEEVTRGLGATWEGHIVTQALYDAAGHNTKFIPIFFEVSDDAFIPAPLRSATRYRLDDDYDSLYRHLTSQPLIAIPPVGTVVARPAREPLPPQPLRERKQDTNAESVPAETTGRDLRETARKGGGPYGLKLIPWLVVAAVVATAGLVLLRSHSVAIFAGRWGDDFDKGTSVWACPTAVCQEVRQGRGSGGLTLFGRGLAVPRAEFRDVAIQDSTFQFQTELKPDSQAFAAVHVNPKFDGGSPSLDSSGYLFRLRRMPKDGSSEPYFSLAPYGCPSFRACADAMQKQAIDLQLTGDQPYLGKDNCPETTVVAQVMIKANGFSFGTQTILLPPLNADAQQLQQNCFPSFSRTFRDDRQRWRMGSIGFFDPSSEISFRILNVRVF